MLLRPSRDTTFDTAFFEDGGPLCLVPLGVEITCPFGWKADIALDPRERHRHPMSLKPESQFIVEVTDQDEIACQPPTGPRQRIKVSDIGSVHFQTGDGPFETDWGLLSDANGELAVSFPLGARGEDVALDRLRQLPEFTVDGMNSTARARFLCWKAATA